MNRFHMGVAEPEPEIQQQPCSPRFGYYMQKNKLYDDSLKIEVEAGGVKDLKFCTAEYLPEVKVKEPEIQVADNPINGDLKEIYDDDLLLQKPSFNLTPRALQMCKQEQYETPSQHKARGLHGSLHSELRDLQDDMDELTRELMSLKQQVRKP